MAHSIHVQWAVCELVLTAFFGLTFRHSPKARIVEDPQKLNELWAEGLRVWFPKGPKDSEIAVLAVDVEQATYWTDAASMTTYAWAYVKARLTGKSPSADEIVTEKSVSFYHDRTSGSTPLPPEGK